MTLRIGRLERASHDWRTLLDADPNATPAHCPELWQALVSALPGFRVEVLEARDDDRLVGGAAVAIERRAGLQWLHALPFVLPGAPLALTAYRAGVDDAVAQALAAMQRELRVAGGEWACYRPAGDAVNAAALAHLSGETRWLEAAVVSLAGGLDEAKRRMDRKTRQEIMRPAAGLRCEDAPEALEEAFALHARQSRRWHAHRPIPLVLSRRLIESGVAHLFAARDAGGLLCATLALDGGHETFVWWSGAHPRARASDAFARLMWWVAEWAAARARLRFNLGASRDLPALERFKVGLGANVSRYPVRWIDARCAPPLGRAAAALQAVVRRGRTRGAAA